MKTKMKVNNNESKETALNRMTRLIRDNAEDFLMWYVDASEAGAEAKDDTRETLAEAYLEWLTGPDGGVTDEELLASMLDFGNR